MTRIATHTVLATVLFSGAFLSCDNRPKLSIDLRIPSAVQGVVTYELGAFPDGNCATLAPALVGGLPLVGPIVRTAFPQGGAPLAMGELAPGSYAFGVVGRDEDCKVLATGCGNVTLDGTQAISIDVAATKEAGGACSQDSTCLNARCVPKPVTETPGCTMSVVSYGALEGTINSASVAVSGPSVVADDDGFRVGYRLVDLGGGANSRYGYITINNSGAVVAESAPQPFTEGCDNVPLSDGLGFVRMNKRLLMLMSLPHCEPTNTKPRHQGGLDLIDFTNPDAPKTLEVERVSQTPALASQNALTVFNNQLLAIRAYQSRTGTTGNVEWHGINPNDGTDLPNVLGFLAPDLVAAAEMVGSSSMLATLSQGKGAVYVRAQPTLADFMTPAKVTDQVSTYSGTWGHIATKGKRAFLLRGQDLGATLTVHDPAAGKLAPFTAKPADPGTQFGISLNPDGGPSGGGALLVHGSHVFALTAQAQQGIPTLTLATFAGASTKLFQTHATYITPETGAPALSTMRDSKVMVAANASRVLVVWASSTSQNGVSTLKKGEALGGYMQFACTDENP